MLDFWNMICYNTLQIIEETNMEDIKMEPCQQMDRDEGLKESLNKTHGHKDQIQANIARSLMNINKNIDDEYAEYEKKIKGIKHYDADLIGKTHLVAVANTLSIMKSAMNLEIKRIAKEIV